MQDVNYSELSSIQIRGDDDRKYTPSYFRALVETLKPHTAGKRPIALILVCHIVPTLPHYLIAARELGRIAAIIPKGSAHDSEIKQDAIKICPGNIFRDDVNRDLLEIPAKAISFLNSVIRAEEQGIIIDIGGYFAFAFPAMCQNAELMTKLVGIVEDTENGHQRYINPDIIKHARIPVFSVAQCKLKRTEDYNVGKAIARAADTLFRVAAHTMTERMTTVGVIGYGKIGHGIASCLRQMGAKQVYICEVNPLRAMLASSHGFDLVDKAFIMDNCEAIYCATGNKCISGDEFARLKDNVYIASCTSSNDELNLEWLKTQPNPVEKNHIIQYKIPETGRVVNLMHRGDSVNFLYNAVVGPFIYSVQGALLKAMANIASGQNKDKLGQVLELSEYEEEEIGRIWLNTFTSPNKPGMLVLPVIQVEDALIFRCSELVQEEVKRVKLTLTVEKGGVFIERNVTANTVISGSFSAVSKLNLSSSVQALLSRQRTPAQQHRPQEDIVIKGVAKRDVIETDVAVMLDEDSEKKDTIGDELSSLVNN